MAGTARTDLAGTRTARAVALDLWADIACPWCFLGHRTLQDLLSSADVGPVRRNHRAFLLRPDMPPGGIPYDDLMRQIFGSRGAAEPSEDRLRALGIAVGIRFDFGAMPVAANSRLAHQAVLASGPADQTQVLDAMYSAYWEHGLDITDPDEVQRIAIEATDGDRDRFAADHLGSVDLELELAEARRIGIQAVPTFIADGRVAVQGAQPAEVLRRLLDQARQ